MENSESTAADALESESCCAGCPEGARPLPLGRRLPWLRRALPTSEGGTLDQDEAIEQLRERRWVDSLAQSLPWLAGGPVLGRGNEPGLPEEWAIATAESTASVTTDPAPRSHSGAAVRYAINTPKFFESNSAYASDPTACADTPPNSPADAETPTDCYVQKYGTAQQIMDDVRRLGATIARHPNVVNFFTGSFDWPDGAIPLWSGSGSDPDGDTIIRGSAVWTLLGFLASPDSSAPGWDAADRPRVRLALTFLSLGGGGAEACSTTADAADTNCAAWSSGDAAKGRLSKPTPLTWSAAHVGQTVEYHSFFNVDDAWDCSTLDPANPYKRVYYRYMIESICRGLADLGYTDENITNHIESIEIGNEVDIRDLLNDGTGNYVADAESWAAIVFDAATEIKRNFPSLKVKLPALASTASAALHPEAEWAAKTNFVGGLVRTLYGWNGSVPVENLIDGIDLHFYHRNGTDASTGRGGDVERLAFLVADVGEVTKLLVTSSGWLSRLAVSVIESGVGTYCTDSTDTWTDGYESGCEASASQIPVDDFHFTDGAMWTQWDASGADTDTIRKYDAWNDGNSSSPLEDWRLTHPDGTKCVGVNDFQAVSLWVRLAAIAASGAKVAGWHCLMAPDGDAGFATTGLRRDFHLDGDDPGVALQRPAYAAFRRYTAFLGTAGAVNLVSPTRDGAWDSSHDDLQRRLDAGSWSLANDVWVVEYVWSPRLLENRADTWISTPYAYLVFVDPAGSATTAEVTLTMPSPPDDPAIYVVATRPTAVTHVAATDGGLPEAVWEYPSGVDAGYGRYGGSTITRCVERGGYPVLVLSNQRMTATIVTPAGSSCAFSATAGCA